MAGSGRIRLPMAIDAKAREDFTLFVITTPTAVTRRGSGSGGLPIPWTWEGLAIRGLRQRYRPKDTMVSPACGTAVSV